MAAVAPPQKRVKTAVGPQPRPPQLPPPRSPQPPPAPSEQELVEALKIENTLRTSAAGQAQFAAAERNPSGDWLDAAETMQQGALRQAGLLPTPSNLALLRDAALRHPELALYVRYNRCRRGELAVGKPAPDVPLVTLEGKVLRLEEVVGAAAAAGLPLVLVAGSYS